jgi:hypothetical protein
MRIGSISELGEPTGMENGDDKLNLIHAFHQWRGLLKTVGGSPYTNQEAFARTLLCNRFTKKDLRDLTASDHLRCVLGTFADLSLNLLPSIALDPLLIDFLAFRSEIMKQEEELNEDQKKTIWGHWLLACSRYMWDRRFFITAGCDMGLAPLSTLVGDTICILFGCTSPLVLRPKEGYYEVIGETYVNGLMYGEAMASLEQTVFEVQEFELR